jgi:hypothetical protein
MAIHNVQNQFLSRLFEVTDRVTYRFNSLYFRVTYLSLISLWREHESLGVLFSAFRVIVNFLLYSLTDSCELDC